MSWQQIQEVGHDPRVHHPQSDRAERRFPADLEAKAREMIAAKLRKVVRRDQVIELSERDCLPKWRAGADVDQWERGNRWVMEMARSAGADRVTLIAFWDGKPTGECRGGTAHMVQIARACGDIDVQVIDGRELVA